jgi:uridine kinase
MKIKFSILFVSLLFWFSKIAFSAPVIIIGVSGGSGSGKTTFSKKLKDMSGFGSRVGLVSQDNYFFPLSKATEFVNGQPNGDHPSSMDFKTMKVGLKSLKERSSVQIPKYDEKTDTVLPGDVVGPFDVVIFEGIHAFYDSEVRELMDYKIFLDIDSKLRFERRLARDKEDPIVLRKHFDQIVDPMYVKYIYPMIEYADYIISSSGEYEETLEKFTKIVADHIVKNEVRSGK